MGKVKFYAENSGGVFIGDDVSVAELVAKISDLVPKEKIEFSFDSIRGASVDDSELHVFCILTGVAGEVEGCSCVSGGIREGGLLQSLFVLSQISARFQNVNIVIGPGVLERGDGTFSEDDHPVVIVDLLENISDGWRWDGAALFNEKYMREPVPLIGPTISDRGEEMTVLFTLLQPEDLDIASANDVSPTIRRNFVLSRARGNNPPENVELLRNGYFAETVRVAGSTWEEYEVIQDLRDWIIVEWLKTFPVSDTRVESQACITCHQDSYSGWRKMGTHSNAWGGLGLHDKKNVFCVTCHTTGLDRDFLSAREFSVNTQNQNVKCAACHSAGNGPCTGGVVRPTFETCTTCHSHGRGEDLISRYSLRDLVGCTRQD